MRRPEMNLRRIAMGAACTGAVLAASLSLTASGVHAAATDKADKKPQPAKAAPAKGASASVVINLIRLLVQQGVLTQDKADALIRQAEDEAAMAARGQAVAGASGGAASGTPTSVRVPYVPEIVKRQIRDEVKQDVMAQAREEHWAAPDALPEWVQRIRLSGDFRFRQQWDIFDKRNSAFMENYQSLNSGSPFNLAELSTSLPPLLDTTENRERQRVRLRLGLDADIDDQFSVGVRLATGNTTDPVTTNQTLGNDLANDPIDLDRAFIRYHPAPWGTFYIGRMPDPWFATDLVWDDNLNFDGVAGQFAYPVLPELNTTLVLGVFPIENTELNFPDNSADKVASRDKWLYGGQVGAEWRPDKDYEARFGVAYYYFQNVEGEESSPCDATTSTYPCDTDNTRPLFMQQGNTLFALRNLTQLALNAGQYQYFGLASKFHELDVTARFDYTGYDPIHLLFDLDFVTNLGFNRAAIQAKDPVNNRAGSTNANLAGPWNGGNNGMYARLTAGYPVLHEAWEWNVYTGYKYLESDAVIDAFTAADFHLGGTNAKGYIFGGGIGIAHNLDLSARWFSTREITGPPLSVDTVQVDLNGRF